MSWLHLLWLNCHAYTALGVLAFAERDNCTTCHYCEHVGEVGEEINGFTGLVFTILALSIAMVIPLNSRNFLFLSMYSLLGPGLMAMHLYQSTWAEHIDSMSIIIFIAFYFWYSMSECGWKWAGATAGAVCLLESTLIEFLTAQDVRGWNTMSWLILVGVVDGVCKKSVLARLRHKQTGYALYVFGVVLFLVASIMQLVGRWVCSEFSFFQFHAAWHSFAGIGLAVIFLSTNTDELFSWWKEKTGGYIKVTT